jgi:NADH-quinone oxidoreductase subunit G
VRATAELLTGIGQDVVIVWGERLAADGDAVRALLNLAGTLKLTGADGAGLLELPSGANGRGLREVGCLPDAGPGYAELERAGRAAADTARAAADGDLTALYLLGTDPVRSLPDAGLWRTAMEQASVVVAHASTLTAGLAEHATVIFPSESYAEKEGTIVHPDGRVQRLRPAIGRPGEVRAEWQVIADVARRCGLDFGLHTGSMASAQVFAAVPFYRGLSLDALGGRGISWPESVAAAALPAGERGPFELRIGDLPPRSHDRLRIGAFRSVWAGPEVELSPALAFLHRGALAELSPDDAKRLGVAQGQTVVLRQNGTSVEAEAVVRHAIPGGTVFVSEPGAFTEPLVEVAKK